MEKPTFGLFLALAMNVSTARADVVNIMINPCQPITARLSIRVQSQGAVVHLEGTPTVSYTIEASSDLKTWNAIATVALDDDGKYDYVDSSGSSIRFYRAKPVIVAGCPQPNAGGLADSTDPVEEAMNAQLQLLWASDLASLQGAMTEAAFVALLPSLRITPAEKQITSLLATVSQASPLLELMLSINRASVSKGASAHVTTLLNAQHLGVVANRAAAFGQLKNVICACDGSCSISGQTCTDPDGNTRSFLVRMMMALPKIQSSMRSFVMSELTSDLPGLAQPPLTAPGRRLYRSELYRSYLLTSTDPGQEVSDTGTWLSRITDQQDKASMLNMLFVAHPSLMATYIARQPAAAVMRARTGVTP